MQGFQTPLATLRRPACEKSVLEVVSDCRVSVCSWTAESLSEPEPAFEEPALEEGPHLAGQGELAVVPLAVWPGEQAQKTVAKPVFVRL